MRFLQSVLALFIATVLASCSSRIPFAYCKGDADCPGSSRSPEEDIAKHILHTAQVLDCLSEGQRACGHIYPQGALELCSLKTIVQRKSDGQLISGPDIGWVGPGRHEGVFIGINVVGDPALHREAYYIYHIGMDVYRNDLPPETVGALRGYCTGQPNYIGGGDSSTHCVCGVGAGGVRREFCHVYKNGKIVDTIPGNDSRCGP